METSKMEVSVAGSVAVKSYSADLSAMLLRLKFWFIVQTNATSFNLNYVENCKSQPQKGYVSSKIKYRRFPSYLLYTLLLFPFHLLPSPVHPTGFSFCFFPGFLAIFILLSWNNSNNLHKPAQIMRYIHS